MIIGILRIGHVNLNVIEKVRGNLNLIFPETECQLVPRILNLPLETLDKLRMQYRSDLILSLIQEYAGEEKALTRVLGVVDVDIFVPGLNFVFGEAECPGKVALISLWRLRPEFYNAPQNFELFVERSTKEAVHELGHTLGLKHCTNPFCVMYFSNSIFETDRKNLFCKGCYLKAQSFIAELNRNSG
ncbi:MAG: archaemetzincin family Zn-dependent metalloprotease [Candidatus Bathyarchaeia archaeon]